MDTVSTSFNLKKRTNIINKMNAVIDSTTFIIEEEGHIFRKNQIKNPYSIYMLPCGKEISRVSCTGNIDFFLIDLDDWLKYRVEPDGQTPVTWYVNTSIHSDTEHYYVMAKYTIDGIKKPIKLHQLIKNWYGHGCKGLTVDHEDICSLNNLSSNLRIITKKEQRSNRTPMKIKRTAELPEGFDAAQKIKHISWEPTRGRFVIQHHPLQKSKRYKPVIYSSGRKDLGWIKIHL